MRNLFETFIDVGSGLILYRLAAFDLLPSTESKLAIMLMAQKLGNIPIPKEDV